MLCVINNMHRGTILWGNDQRITQLFGQRRRDKRCSQFECEDEEYYLRVRRTGLFGKLMIEATCEYGRWKVCFESGQRVGVISSDGQRRYFLTEEEATEIADRVAVLNRTSGLDAPTAEAFDC